MGRRDTSFTSHEMAEPAKGDINNALVPVNPTAGVIVTAVIEIGGICNDVHEARALCEQHYGRIRRIQDHFTTLNDANKLPASDVIQLYHTILQTTYKEMHAYKEMRFLQRLLNYRRLKNTLAQLNVDLVDLYGALPLVAIGQVAQLRQDVGHEARWLEGVIRKEFAKNANQFRRELGQSTPQAQAEAYTLLKHEEKKYNDGEPDQPVETQEAIHDALIYLVSHSRGDLRSPPVWFIVATDITIGDDLDSGSFANVSLGKWKGAPVVIKMVLPRDNGLDEPTRRQFITEAEVWFSFDHPNVLRLFGACHLTRKPFIVCEYSRDGNLSRYFSKHRRAAKGNKRMWKLLVEAARGLEYIHSRNVVHGDLKLNNLLIGDDGKARLADFGLSRVKMTSPLFVSLLPDGAPVDGGLRWMAPERFSNANTSYHSDIYSFGMCVVEALLGHPPYETLDNADVRAKIVKGELPEQPAQATDDMWDLVVAMTKMEPRQRMPLNDVIAKLEEFADAEDVEIRLNTVVCTNCDERPPASSNFCNMCRAPLTDAAVELAAVDLAPGGITSLPPLGNVLANLKSESKSTQALKFLSRYTAADSSACRQATGSLARLRDVVSGSSDVVRIVYAFACLKNITLAGFGGIDAAELEEIRAVADQKTQSATSMLVELFTPSADAKRDDRQVLELVELFLVVDPNNHHPAGELVTPLAKMLKDSSQRIRDACVGALAAIVLTGVDAGSSANLELLSHEDVVKDVVSSLLLVLDVSESSVKRKAIHLLAEITTSRSAAMMCANRRAIDIILQVFRRESDASYDHALCVIANLAEKTDMVQLIGGRGVVVDLVDLLKEGGADDRTQLAFNVLARLVKDEGNADQFKRAGGVDALETMLSQESRRGDTLKNLANMTEKSEYVRREIASSARLVTQCVTAMQSGTADEKMCTARVCRELAKESVSVVEQLRSAGGIDALEVLARSGNEFASKALANAIATQEKARIAAGVFEAAPFMQTALMYAGVSPAMEDTANTAPAAETPNTFDGTALHKAAASGDHGAVRLLLIGALSESVNAVSTLGDTALHLAAERGNVTVVKFLIEFGADTKKANQRGETPLHRACLLSQYEVARDLVVHDSALSCIKTADGYTPFHLAICAALDASCSDASLRVLHLCVVNGSRWDEVCDSIGGENGSRTGDSSSSFCSLRAWVSMIGSNLLLPSLPIEVFRNGLKALQTFYAGVEQSQDASLHRKIAVLGHNRAGKTSFILSLGCTEAPRKLQGKGDIRIDRFTLSFPEQAEADSINHELVVWDFVGIDVYQGAHALFFTERTLYLICVDLAAYATARLQAELMADDDRQLAAWMGDYVQSRVFRWVNLVQDQHPSAEFAFVGTKADIVFPNGEVSADQIAHTLTSQLVEFTEAHIQRLDNERHTLHRDRSRGSPPRLDDFDNVTQLQGYIARLPDTKWIVPAVKGAARADDWLKRLVIESGRSFPATGVFKEVLRHVTEMADDARPRRDADRVKATFMEIASLRKCLLERVDGLANGWQCDAVLGVLHELSDVVWYHGLRILPLDKIVIIDPGLLFELVTTVLAHRPIQENINEQTNEVLPNGTLRGLPLWRAINNDDNDFYDDDAYYGRAGDVTPLLGLMRLMQHFNLVFPTEGEMSAWSDLSVPAYWRTQTSASWLFGGDDLRLDHRAIESNEPVRIKWEYKFTSLVPETLFDRFVVASYNTYFVRAIGPDWILYRDPESQYACRAMVVRDQKTHRPIIRVEVVAAAKMNDLSNVALQPWTTLRHLCKALESVSWSYRATRMHRNALDLNNTPKNMMVILRNPPPELVPWLPPELTWYESHLRAIGVLRTGSFWWLGYY